MGLMLIQVLFYVFAAMAVFSALMVVGSSNPVRSVLFLVLAFVASAGIWLLLNAEFLALILVLVYVGAVMTLFLFVVMMLNVDLTNKRSFVRYLPLGLLISAVMVGLIVMVVGPDRLGLSQVSAPALEPADYNNTADLGAVLYTTYALPFEIAAVLLLTAIVAAISLTHRRPEGRKIQRADQQINVRREDRIRLIKMQPNKKDKL